VAAMLRSLGRDEVEATLDEQDGRIEVHCEFCAQRYEFDRVDAEHLLRDAAATGAPGTPQ